MCFRVEKKIRQLEKRKQNLMEMYNQRKRGSDSSQGSSGIGPSKKSSVASMDPLQSPSSHKKVLLQEYEEGELPLKGKKDVSKRSSEDSGHPHSESREKISEMERRVKEELEAEFKPKRAEDPSSLSASRSWSKVSNFTSPLHSSASDRHSPVVGGRWVSGGLSEVHPVPSHTAPPPSGHFPPLSPTATAHLEARRSGFHDNGRKVSHSDSSEWTEFACASTSGGSVEVGGQLGSSVYSSRDTLCGMSEFDPISTSISGDFPKPPAT